MSGIQHASNQSIKAFKSSEEYLYAMKEDLAEWLKDLYTINIDVNNILEVLETGAILCHHANNVTRVAEDFLRTYGQIAGIRLPSAGVTCVSSAQPSTFLARDNISNFIHWCRKQLGIPDVLMFETDDLVLRKNEKHFILCLLEVARRASRFGMAAPVLIQLEQEIEEEIREEMDLPMEQTPLPKPQRRLANIQNLDEMVRCLISRCTCPTQFPMIKVSEGKYKVGDSNTLIFVRILRNHVMVRVGGGWDTLEHYLDKHDPCRCTSLSHKLSQRPSTPAVHEIKARVGTKESVPGAGTPAMPSMFVLSRAQSPPQPVVWSTPGPGRGPSRPSLCRSPDPGPRQPPGASPSRLRQRATTPGRRQSSENRDDCGLNASTRTGREARRASVLPRHATSSSLPRSRTSCLSPAPHRDTTRSVTPHVGGGHSGQKNTETRRSMTPHFGGHTGQRNAETIRPVTPHVSGHTGHKNPEIMRPVTPHVNAHTGQKTNPAAVQQHPPPGHSDSRLNHTFAKSQLMTKVRHSTGPGDVKSADGGGGQGTPDRQRGHQGTVRPYTPVQQQPHHHHHHPQNIPPPSSSSSSSTSSSNIIKHGVTENSHNSHRTSSSSTGGHSSTKGHVTSDGLPPKPSAQIKKVPSGHPGENIFQKKTVGDEQTARRDVPNSAGNGSTQQQHRRQSTAKQNVFHPAASGQKETPKSRRSSNVLQATNPALGRVATRGTEEASLFITPPPITPDQEAILYQSLEHEILSNLQKLNFDYDDDEDDDDDSASSTRAAAEEEDEEDTEEEDGQSSSLHGPQSADISSRQSLSSVLRQESTSSNISNTSGHTKVDGGGGGGGGGGKGSVDGVTDVQHGQQRCPSEKVSVERWVNTLPFGAPSRVRRHSTSSAPAEPEADLTELDSMLTLASSWSSMGSSLECRDRSRADESGCGESGGGASPPSRHPGQVVMDDEELAMEFSRQRRPRSSSFRQKRGLRKPERVPSIYKLKLKPHIRPREDHRPNHKPSRIPKPVAYQQGRGESEGPGGLGKGCCTDNNGLSSSPDNNRPPRFSGEGVSTKMHDGKSRVVPQGNSYGGFEGREDTAHVMEELESWV